MIRIYDAKQLEETGTWTDAQFHAFRHVDINISVPNDSRHFELEVGPKKRLPTNPMLWMPERIIIRRQGVSFPRPAGFFYIWCTDAFDFLQANVQENGSVYVER